MTDLSRRAVAKGAAWAVPSVSLAAAAPALAASPTTCVDTYVCPSAPMALQVGSMLGATVAAGNGTYPGGSYFSVGLGQWNVPKQTYTHTCPGQPDQTITATGYYLNFTTGPLTNVTDRNGKAYAGTLTAYTPVGNSPQVAGAGLSTTLNIQTSIPYTGLSCSKAQNLGTFSVPFQIVYLNGLTPLATTASCSYVLNVSFMSATICSPTLGGTYTIT